MNLLLYLIFSNIVFLCTTTIVNCDNNYKIFECHQNNVKIIYDISNHAKSKLPCLSMSPTCFQIKKQSKKHEIKQKPKYKGPKISYLLQSGVQETIQFAKKHIDKDTYRFYESNNLFVDIPSPTKEFKFRAFAPDNFLTLRNLYKISEDFDTSFQTSELYTADSSKDFMDTYYYTRDTKFYINIIAEENFEFVVSFLSEYYFHFCQNRFSLLPKISGLFHLKHKNFELYFIVKPNIFSNISIRWEKIFYTKGIPEKGSLINDEVYKRETCRKENDILIFFRKGLIIPLDTYKSLQKVLAKDTEFLKSLDISDYIFMLSVISSDNFNNDVQPTLVNQLQDVMNPDQYDMKTDNMNLIAYIGIDNIYQKKKKTDQTYYKFNHLHCKFKHQVNQNTYDYGEHFVNFITKQVFKSNG